MKRRKIVLVWSAATLNTVQFVNTNLSVTINVPTYLPLCQKMSDYVLNYDLQSSSLVIENKVLPSLLKDIKN